MERFFLGMMGGVIPAAFMIIIYLLTLSGRLAKIETNIQWIIKTIEKCLQH